MFHQDFIVTRVLVALWPVDFRNGHLGLLGISRRLGFEPWQGDVLVFPSRGKTKLKILAADNNGLWVLYKQFAKGAFKTELKFLSDETVKTVSTSELGLLLAGHRYKVDETKPPWRPKT